MGSSTPVERKRKNGDKEQNGKKACKSDGKPSGFSLKNVHEGNQVEETAKHVKIHYGLPEGKALKLNKEQLVQLQITKSQF